MHTLSVHLRNEELNIEFIGRSRLRDLLISHGVNMDFPCGGNGRCGRCTVLLDGREVQACRAYVSGDAVVTLPASASFEGARGGDTAKAVSVKSPEHSEKCRRIGAAIDLGTTNVEAELVDLDTGDILNYGKVRNPQGRYGADVISRITAALSGKGTELKRLGENGIYALLYDLLDRPDEDLSFMLERLVIAGNTTMLYLLTGRDPVSLSKAPLEADHFFGESGSILKMPVWYPPCLHAFIGADITCAVLASGMTDREETALLADFGTNGEMALYTGGKLYIASASCGPAFEKGSIPGSELVDAVAGFLEKGLVDETGMIEGMDRELHCGDSVVTIEDIRDLQLAKAAIYAGIRTLLRSAHCPAKNVEKFYIAGNFGKNLNVKNAVRIGLVPRTLEKKAVILGNASLSGAAMLLKNPELQKKAEEFQKICRHTDLGGNPVFNDLFIRNMGFEI